MVLSLGDVSLSKKAVTADGIDIIVLSSFYFQFPFQAH